MRRNKLHIVCLDVPFPPDYGGVFDLYYKIKYLSQLGVGIILHCFEYGRGRQPELEKFCEEVYYYPRKPSISLLVPYIVFSRRNSQLLGRLVSDDNPVLLEGIHCSYYLFRDALKNKKCFVRLHNVEYEYYDYLAKSENNILRKLYFKIESVLLRKYEKELAPKGKFLCVSERDKEAYQALGAAEAIYLPIFTGQQSVTSQTGKGCYCLYHGNLSVPENEEAVMFLIKKVFSGLNIPLVIAGRNPSSTIRRNCRARNIKLIINPEDPEMNQFLTEAHIHILPSMNNTGIKIKLVQALFKGRFVVTNFQGAAGSHLENLCRICNTTEEFRNTIKELMVTEFNDVERQLREKVLLHEFDGIENGKKLIKLLFN